MTTKKTDLEKVYTGTDYLPAAKLIELATKANTESIINVVLEAYSYGYEKGLQQKGQAN